MSKFILLTPVCLAVTGCASLGAWRTLTIDGRTESAFVESVTLMDQELPRTYSEMFQLALADIAYTGTQIAGETDEGGPAYSDEDFRRELDGLTYDGVIALADQSGTPISRQYYAGRRVVDSAFGNQAWTDPSQGQPIFNAAGQPISDFRPGGTRWPLGADERGRAIYP